jgi:hypothetical protein
MNNKTTKLTGTKKTTRTTTTVTKYSDAQQTIKNIDAKLEQVRAVFGRPFRTNGESKTTTVNPTNVNVRAATNIALLIAILGEITAKGEQYNKAATMLGLTQYPNFNWQGYSYESWLFDIKLRIEQINQVTTENELLAIRNDLQEFVTKEDKLSMLQERMAKLGI